MFDIGLDSKQNATLDQKIGLFFLVLRWWNGAFSHFSNTASPQTYFKWGTSLQTKLLQIGWTSVKWYFLIEKHFILIVLVSFDLPWGETFGGSYSSAKPCPLGHCTGWCKEAQGSWGDYFFNKRKHWEGKCLKAVVIWGEMTKWLLWFKTKQNTTATFFIFVRNVVQGGEKWIVWKQKKTEIKGKEKKKDKKSSEDRW